MNSSYVAINTYTIYLHCSASCLDFVIVAAIYYYNYYCYYHCYSLIISCVGGYFALVILFITYCCKSLCKCVYHIVNAMFFSTFFWLLYASILFYLVSS